MKNPPQNHGTSPLCERNVIFSIWTGWAKHKMNSWGNIPVVTQKVLSLPSSTFSGGYRSSIQDAITILLPCSWRAKSFIRSPRGRGLGKYKYDLVECNSHLGPLWLVPLIKAFCRVLPFPMSFIDINYVPKDMLIICRHYYFLLLFGPHFWRREKTVRELQFLACFLLVGLTLGTIMFVRVIKVRNRRQFGHSPSGIILSWRSSIGQEFFIDGTKSVILW